MGNVLQILGVGGELAEERPAALDVAEMFLVAGFFLRGRVSWCWRKMRAMAL
jgi:hypothetical protein